MPFCSNCGQPLADGAKFCGNCGAPVTSAEPAQPSQPAADTSESTQPAYSTQGGTGYQSYGEQSYQPQQPYGEQSYQPQQPYGEQSYQPQQPYGEQSYQPQQPYGEQSYQPQPSFSTQDGTGYQTQQTYTGNGRIPPDVPSKGKPKTGLIIGIVAAVVVVAAVLIFIFLFTGRDINFAGYWECEGIDYGGVEIVDEVDGIDVSDLAALMLNSDQTFTMTLYGEGSQTGTWSSSGRTVTLTANGESVEMSYRDEELRVDLSSGGETFILYFEYAGARAPAGFGEASVPATTPPSDNVQNTDEPSADPTEVPAADPNVSTELGAEAYYDFGDFTVEILGGQPASDDYTDNCFRVFYRFTNNTDEPTSAWMELYLYAYQDGVELDTDWVDGAETDDYDSLNIMPGASIVCSQVFSLNGSSPLTFYACEDWDLNETECATGSFDVASDTAADIDYSIPAVTNPTWTENLTDEYTWDNFYVFIDSAETTTSWDGTDLIRVYFDWTNNTDGATSFWMESTVIVLQDDVELFSGYADEESVSDDMFSSNIEPGSSVTVSNCYELRSSSPVVVLVYNWDADEYIGCTFYFNN